MQEKTARNIINADRCRQKEKQPTWVAFYGRKRLLCDHINPIHQITAKAVKVTSVSIVTP